MEFRDIVGVASVALAFVTFAYNWYSARGWQKKVALRDELSRFAVDEQVSTVVADEARRTAERAAVYLSLELSEIARQSAAKSARRASASVGRAAVKYGLLLVVTIPIFLVAAVAGWGQRDAFSNTLGAAYFGGGSVFFVWLYFHHLRSLCRARRETRELNAFREEVVNAKSLTSRDVKMTRPR